MISGFGRRTNEIFALPGCYAAHCCSKLPTLWNILSAQSSRAFLDCLTLGDVTDRLSRNVGIWPLIYVCCITSKKNEYVYIKLHFPLNCELSMIVEYAINISLSSEICKVFENARCTRRFRLYSTIDPFSNTAQTRH